MTQSTIQETFDQACQHHQAGKLPEAERLYRQVLAERPGHSQAMHLLGMIALHAGRDDVAMDLIRRSISISPDNAEAHSNLGLVLRDKGQHDQAIDSFHQALRLNPNLAEVHYNLGNALRDKGQYDQAIESFRRAILIRPNYAEAHCNLGNVLNSKGLLDEAISAYHQAIALKPRQAPIYSNLGNVLKAKGQFDEAITAYRQAIALWPDYAEAHNNLGNALKEIGQLDQAITAFAKAAELRSGWAMPCLGLGQLFREQGRYEEASLVYKQAAEREPDNADAHNGLAKALVDLQRFDEAVIAHGRAAALAPDSPLTHEVRGMIQQRCGRGAQAIESLRRVVEIAPDSATGWLNLGQALEENGRFDETAECVRQALARQPDSAPAYTLMATLGMAPEPAEIARLAASLDNPKIQTRDRAELGFALGKMLDKAGRYDDAFAHYVLANRLVLQMRQAAGERYSSDLFQRRVDDLIAMFTPAFFAHTRNWGEHSELPVFIVGMPRSGTSLVEQIASSHPAVLGAGELKDMGNIAASLGKTDCQPGPLKDAARGHLSRLRALGGPALRVIDKMPGNVMYLGLIAALYPSARVILCRRDPRDTCLSCFFQQFGAGNLFSFDLNHCGRYQVDTDRLTAHWQKVLPLRMYEVQYEDLVEDLEGQSRRIIRFLGLDWDPACLDFHRTQRIVQTSSVWQVRQPIYTRSVGRWRNYERHLDPLFEALDLAPIAAAIPQ